MLSKEELNRVVESIRTAEGHTSAEIRVCVVEKCKADPYEAAGRKFFELKMDETALRNAVLIFVAPNDKKTAIVGDSGINEIAGEDFWDTVLHKMLFYFADNEICTGICCGIEMVGELVKASFPVADDDINELSDEVIIDEE